MAADTPAINGKVIQRARMRAGLTLREVSQRCKELGQEVDFSTIARWESGGWRPRSPRMLPVLAKVLGLSVDDLFAAEEDGGEAA